MDPEKLAIQIVEEEKQAWEEATAWVTDKVGFEIRDLIRTFRKNYYGIFEEEIDPITGNEKTWIPLTETLVESVVKNIDMDSKDVRFRARHEEGTAMTELTRAVTTDYLDKTYFGEDLDEAERNLSIDGTVVWKTWEQDGQPRRKEVDLLNFYIDPSAEDIQSAHRVTERAVMSVHELQQHDGWDNTGKVEGQDNLPNTDPQHKIKTGPNEGSNSTPEIDVYELWGLVPEAVITENPDDTEMVEGHVVVSGLEGDSEPVLHLAERNTTTDVNDDVIKPYEEVRYKRVPGLWYGRGIAWQVLPMQLYLNTIVNIRINRSRISQLGLFKIKKGSGITPQSLRGLPANGAIKVKNMDDIEQFVMKEASQASYKDEEQIVNWSQRLTSAFESVMGEQLPASTPATNAAIQDKNAKAAFKMVQKAIGSFIQRWMDRHALPILAKNLEANDVVRLLGDDDDMAKALERAVAYEAQEEFKDFREAIEGMEFNSPEQVEQVKQKVQEFKEEMQKRVDELRNKPEVFIEIYEEITEEMVDTHVYMTNEEIDVGVTVQNLSNLMQGVPPQMQQPMLEKIFDLLGLDMPEMEQRQPQPQQQPQQGQPQGQQAGSLQELVTNANTRQNVQAG